MYDAKLFLEALDELESNKGIGKDDILKALQEALEKGFKKQLGGDDANVKVIIDPTNGQIYMAQIKNVVEDVQDDFLEISLTDARKTNKKINLGDEFAIEESIDEIKKATAMSIKTVLKQKIAEVEKNNLYDRYKDKIGEMITGRVEKVEENGVTVSLDRTSVYLPKQQLIGDEKFVVGEPIKLFVSDVASGPKGAHIVVSRSNEGFLKRVFEEEIHEIYDGTIIIKGIAREAGERSKVAVYSHDPNVDPAGACIGPNGSRIQKVVAQLGNGPQKEKIDIIAHNDNPGLFIMESLKPAQVIGIKIEPENKQATAVVKNDSLSLAIGKKGVNVRLACRLTGYSIDIKEQDTAIKEGIIYSTAEELERRDIERKQKEVQDAFNASTMKAVEQATPIETSNAQQNREAVPEGYVAPSARVYQTETISDEEREALEAEVDREEETIVIEPKVQTPTIQPEIEVKTEIAVVPPVPETPITTVKTTKTLEDLEKELEAEAQRAKATVNKFRRNKKKEVEEVEDASKSAVDPAQRMSIYTDDELKELEKEDDKVENDEIVVSSDDVDYDEYDKYYDDSDQ